MTVTRAQKNRIATQLAHLPDNFLLCRDIKHSYDVNVELHSIKYVGDPSTYLRRELLCRRCGTVRHENFALVKGEVEKLRSTYTYPPGYQMVRVPRGVKAHMLIHTEMYARVQQLQEQDKKSGRLKSA